MTLFKNKLKWNQTIWKYDKMDQKLSEYKYINCGI
jgi:hypothetical protein